MSEKSSEKAQKGDVQEKVDEEQDQGFLGEKVDPIPDEEYTLQTGPASPPYLDDPNTRVEQMTVVPETKGR